MGLVCCKRMVLETSSGGHSVDTNTNGQPVHYSLSGEEFSLSTDILGSRSAHMNLENMEKELQEHVSVGNYGILFPNYVDVDGQGEPNHLSRSPSAKSGAAMIKSTTAKVSEMGSLIGRASSVGLGKAVEVLDTLGSSVTSLNRYGGFSSGVTSKGNKIDILAFEVANTIVKGANLKHSLSDENIRVLKEEILYSEGVQRLVSDDMDELLTIAAADKKKELKIFAGEVVRFGNHCKDPQWHQLDRYFEKLGTEVVVYQQSKEEAESLMQELMTLAQHTAELYHELHALDRFEQDYRRKVHEEESLNIPNKGDSLQIMRSELKSQRKHVRNLQKKSLWSKNLEEVIEKLVDIVYFLHQEIEENFKEAGGESESKQKSQGGIQRLGPAGLALHYANIINQIDTVVSRPSSVPPNTRDSLYRGLPPSIKTALRCKLQSSSTKEELSIPQIKAEMDKTLNWLVPIATNTTKAHHGFGWVGEWANTGSGLDRRHPGQNDLTLVQTLHYADKEKTETYIFDLIVWLNDLVNMTKNVMGNKSPIKSPVRSPVKNFSNPLKEMLDKAIVSGNGDSKPLTELSQEDKDMLKAVNFRKLIPGISKSQELGSPKISTSTRTCMLTKSNSHSSTTNTLSEFSGLRSHAKLPIIDFDIDRNKALDVIDRVDSLCLL